MKASNTNAPLDEVLRLKPDYSPHVISTIGDAAAFIRNLPKNYNGKLHWTVAGAALDAATMHEGKELISHATRAMKNALETDNMLEIVSME